MFFLKKTGFTLIELLVVIAIIGVLAAAMTTQFTKVRESARATKCKANLKNLVQAAISYAVQNQEWPSAGPYEYDDLNESGQKTEYREKKAWVQWTGSGSWPSFSSQAAMMTKPSFYGDNALLSITNGVLWDFVGKDLSTYVCEVHRAAAQKTKLTKVLRSYVMNGYFRSWENCRMDNVNADGKAGNLLAFAELPAQDVETSDTARDGALDTKTYTSNEEYIGFNHLVGKRYVAHVVFADGHVDALMEPSGKAVADLKDLKSLTKELCAGEEIDQTVRNKMH